jgi:hypothetical protein
MRRKRLTVSLLALLLLLCANSGCRFLHGYRPVNIQVRDAETHQPIPGARVRVGYYLLVDPRAPKLRIGATDDEGKVTLRVAPYEGRAVLVATAPGYFTEGMQSLDDGVIRAFDLDDEKHKEFVIVEMYAEPAAVVELIVPAGYRGLIEVRTQVDEAAQPIHPRLFRATVSAEGLAVVKGPPLLRRAECVDFQAHFDDGTPLEPPSDAAQADGQPARAKAQADRRTAFANENCCDLWPLGDEMEEPRFFFVGTAAEHEASYGLFHKPTPEGGWAFDREAAQAWLKRRSR